MLPLEELVPGPDVGVCLEDGGGVVSWGVACSCGEKETPLLPGNDLNMLPMTE